MQTYAAMPIKDVMALFPRVGDVLKAYGVGCVTCSVGVCPLKDVVSIHHLSAMEEKAIMEAVAAVIDPALPQPVLPSAPPVTAKKLRVSLPIKQLVEEHTTIKQWITAVSGLKPEHVGSEEARRILRSGIDFVRGYADRFHHAKEEEILFDYADKTSAIVRAMYLEHDEGRTLIKQAAEVLDQDPGAALLLLQAHGKLLIEHIRKEDEILYPWIDRGLSRTQVRELIEKFQQVDMAADRVALERRLKFSRDIGVLVERLRGPA